MTIGAPLPTSLLPCSNTTDTELFVVEGLSAANALKPVRDRCNQAVLPMQGKIPNANRTAAAKLLQHPNVADLLQSIHPERIVETDFSRFRFERVILLGDPDADGLHASVLLVLLLSTKLPELINQGRCFMVRAPLYGFFQNEKCVAVAYSDKHAATVEKALSERYAVPSSRRRFKGIASLDSDLRSRLMRKDNPTRRQLLMDECRELCQMLLNQ